jgi:hypothetical protein
MATDDNQDPEQMFVETIIDQEFSGPNLFKAIDRRSPRSGAPMFFCLLSLEQIDELSVAGSSSTCA